MPYTDDVLVLNSPPNLLTEHWQLTANRADLRALAIYERHYSCYQYVDNRVRRQYIAPGEYVSLLTAELDALFVWQKSKYRRDKQQGVNCAVFRNERPVRDGGIRSSDLIVEAMQIAQRRWAGERLFTFVNPDKVKSSNPGYCFLKAGWKACGESAQGLLVLEWIPN